ncbi:MAG: pilus assembly protein TadG-related protein [Candidatus Velthaea sp.]
MLKIVSLLARSADRGQVIPIVAIALVGLFGAAALAVDVGYWRYSQRLQQSAADSAAIAGANELAYPAAADIVAAAKRDAATNGFTDGTSNVAVVVNSPPQSGAYAGKNSAVEVIVSRQQPVFFASIFGGPPQVVSTRAVAVSNTTEIDCIYALAGDITLGGGGGGGITAPTCGLITNQSLVVTGSANVDARTVGYVLNGPAGGVYPDGQPRRSLPVTDPCPTVPGCAYLTDVTLNHPTSLHTGCMPQSPLPNPIPPGEYCSTLTLIGTVNFLPGLFVLDDGLAASGSATITGTGVTLYNGGGVDLSGITFSGNINTNITAPTTGPMTGIVYYQPPGNASDIIVNGRAGTDIFAGVFYAPSAAFTLNGNVPAYTLLVAKSITMNGGGLGASSAGLQTAGHGVLAE